MKGLFKLDGWSNLLSGLGKRGVDKTAHTQFGDFAILDDNQLTRLWIGEGLGAKIVSAVADDMTRAGISIEGDESGEVSKALQEMKAFSAFNLALKWMRLYGGSIIVLGYQDGQALDQHLSSTPAEISYLKVYPRTKVRISSTDIIQDPSSPYFDEVEFFPVETKNGVPIKVHRSRCLIFKGIPVPSAGTTDVTFDMEYWGLSALQQPWDAITQFGGMTQGIANLMQEFAVGKFKLDNLAELVSESNVSALYNRMEVINASKSLLNSVFMGENEEFSRDVVALGGVPEVMDRFMMLLAATTCIPVTRLFGRSPAGQNSTGESDLRNYYDTIQAGQENQLLEPTQMLVNSVNLSLGSPAGESPKVTFNSPWEPTQKERVDMRKTQADTDKVYIELGVLGSDEVRVSRFESGYSHDTSVEGTFE